MSYAISCREPGSPPLAADRSPAVPEPDDTCPLCLSPAVRQAPMLRWTAADGWREVIEARCQGVHRVRLTGQKCAWQPRVQRGCGLVAVEERRVDGHDPRKHHRFVEIVHPTTSQPKEQNTVKPLAPKAKPTHVQCIAAAARIIDKEVTLEDAVRELGLRNGQSLGWAIAYERKRRDSLRMGEQPAHKPAMAAAVPATPVDDHVPEAPLEDVLDVVRDYLSSMTIGRLIGLRNLQDQAAVLRLAFRDRLGELEQLARVLVGTEVRG